MRRVLVTGASGLIGSHVVRALLESGYEPRAFCRGFLPPGLTGVEHVSADIRSRDALERAMHGCDAVIHSAAVYSYARSDAGDMHSVNLKGTQRVLDAAEATGLRRIVVTSSAATCGPVAGRPADERDRAPDWELAVPYKLSKLQAERAALARAGAALEVVVVNPTTTVGAWDRRPTPSGRMIRDVLDRRIKGYIASGGLNVVGAADVARGHVLALERGRSGERYLLGGENLPMSELFALIARLGQVPRPRIPVPYPVALGWASAVDAVARHTGHEPTLLVLDEVRLARLPMYFSSSKAERELSYEPSGAADAVAAAVSWFERVGPAAPPNSLRRVGRAARRTAWGRAALTLGPGPRRATRARP